MLNFEFLIPAAKQPRFKIQNSNLKIENLKNVSN